MAWSLGLSAAAPGCGRSNVKTADVVITWSIDGEESASRCDAYGAAMIEIVITGPSGEHVDTLFHRCFLPHAIDIRERSYIAEGVGVTLPIGRVYLASARLKDERGNPITTTLTTTLSPAAFGTRPEPHFEFGGTFIHGSEHGHGE
jgi:hypothetical protein